MRKNKKYEKNIYRTGPLFLAAVILTTGLTGCNKKVEEEPEEIVMMMEDFGGSWKNGEWLSQIEMFTNTSLDIQGIPTLEYSSFVESKIRSSSLPMVIAANDTIMNMYSLQLYLEEGGFWDIGEYIDDYPNLKAFIGEELWEKAEINGSVYGIPRLRIQARNGALYRKDWAEALNIDPPETLEELYDMLYAFTWMDPDGNGLDDTVGLMNSWNSWGSRQWNGIQTITTALGGPNGWKYEDRTGEMIPDFATEEYMEMLNWFRRLYREGILDASFPILTSAQRREGFEEGFVGMIFSVLDDAETIEEGLKQYDEDAEIGILPMLQFEDTYRVNDTGGYNGFVLFNKIGEGAIQDKETLRRILSFYDRLCSEEGQILLNVENEEAIACQQVLPGPAYIHRESDSTLQQEVYAAVVEREKYLVEDDSQGLYSVGLSQVEAEVNEIIRKASIRYIMGEITETGYWEAYEEWLDGGGNAISELYKIVYEEKYQ